MTHAEFLAANPEAKQEHDTALKTATADGVKAGHKTGTDEVVARIEGCAPYLASDKYPKPISDLAVKVLKGEEPLATLTTTVTVHDSTVEAAASAAAQTDTDGQSETVADETTDTLSTDGGIRSEDDLELAIAQARGEDVK